MTSDALMSPAAFIALTIAQTSSSASNDGYLLAAIVLGGIALLLLGLEVFIPTSGMLALLCGAAAVASVVAMFMWDTAAGLWLLLGYTVATPFLVVVGLKLWSKSPLVKRYTLNNESKSVAATPVVSDEDPDAEHTGSDLSRFRRLKAFAELIGSRGVTETPLRPAGFIVIDGRRIDAVAESGLIEPGTPVRVVAVVDGTLKVRAES